MADAEGAPNLDGFAVLRRDRLEFQFALDVGGFVAADLTAGDDDCREVVVLTAGHSEACMVEIDADLVADLELPRNAKRRERDVSLVADDGLEMDRNFVTFFENDGTACHCLVAELCALAVKADGNVSPAADPVDSRGNVLDLGVRQVNAEQIDAEIRTPLDDILGHGRRAESDKNLLPHVVLHA